jgi:acetoin utilization protein AcuB
MNVGDRMTKHPVTVSPNETLAQAQKKLRGGGFRQLPVIDDRRLIGIITDRDIRRHGRHSIAARVQSVMTNEVITALPNMPIEEAARLLLHHKVGALPVLERNELVGIISTSDILQAFVDLVTASKGQSDKPASRSPVERRRLR